MIYVDGEPASVVIARAVRSGMISIRAVQVGRTPEEVKESTQRRKIYRRVWMRARRAWEPDCELCTVAGMPCRARPVAFYRAAENALKTVDEINSEFLTDYRRRNRSNMRQDAF